MRYLFIPAKAKLELDLKKIKDLPLKENVFIAYSIQNEDYAKQINNILSENHNITGISQVLGCSKLKIPKKTQEILLLSSGKFHGISLCFETGLPVYVLENNKIQKITNQEIENLQQKRKASFVKFLNSEKIGILISTKPGQENLELALKQKFELAQKNNKKSYLFLANNLNTKEFENFKIDSWLNTACPRLDFDSSVINIRDLQNFLNNPQN